MSDVSGPTLSVRGEARRSVPPDYVNLPAAVTSTGASKGEALRMAAEQLDRLRADLAARGGVPVSAGDERHPLVWSAHSATTQPQHELVEATGRYEPTGKVTATVALVITVRDLGSLDELGSVLATHDSLSVQGAVWGVDADNPAWPEVRAAAIRAAILKGRDYAAALGGSLHRVEHIADAGLLTGTDAASYGYAVQQSLNGHYGDDQAPSLDPVPQVLTATIEARVIAVDVSLDRL